MSSLQQWTKSVHVQSEKDLNLFVAAIPSGSNACPLVLLMLGSSHTLQADQVLRKAFPNYFTQNESETRFFSLLESCLLSLLLESLSAITLLSIVSLNIVSSLNESWGHPRQLLALSYCPAPSGLEQGLAESGQAFNKVLDSTKGCNHPQKSTSSCLFPRR